MQLQAIGRLYSVIGKDLDVGSSFTKADGILAQVGSEPSTIEHFYSPLLRVTWRHWFRDGRQVMRANNRPRSLIVTDVP